MSREHIRKLISAIQDRVRPPDRLPLPPEPTSGLRPETVRAGFDDEDLRMVIPPDWQRPKPPEWVLVAMRDEADSPIELEPDDEITIDALDEPGEVLTLPAA
jgi:hypothetical protein